MPNPPTLPTPITLTTCHALPHSHVLRPTQPWPHKVLTSRQMARESLDEAIANDDDDVDDADAAFAAGPRNIPTEESGIRDLIDDLRSQRWRYFFVVPKVKFVMFFTFHVLYLLLLCLVVFPFGPFAWSFAIEHVEVEAGSGALTNGSSSSGGGGGGPTQMISVQEVVFWLWTLALVFAELKEFRNFRLDGIRMYLRSTWNKIDVVTSAAILIAALMRLLCDEMVGGEDQTVGGGSLTAAENPSCLLDDSPWVRTMYALVMLLMFLKLLSYATYNESIGVHVIILGEVLKTDVCCHRLLPNHTPAHRLEAYHPPWLPQPPPCFACCAHSSSSYWLCRP